MRSSSGSDQHIYPPLDLLGKIKRLEELDSQLDNVTVRVRQLRITLGALVVGGIILTVASIGIAVTLQYGVWAVLAGALTPIVLGAIILFLIRKWLRSRRNRTQRDNGR